MTDKPLTPNAVAAQLVELSRKLDQLVQAMDSAELDALHKREDYTVAHSEAFLAAEGPVDRRKHRAIIDTHAERLAAELAEREAKRLQRQIDAVKKRIEVGRSVGATVRTEFGQPGWSQ